MTIKKRLYRILKNFKFLPINWQFKIRHYYHTGKNLHLKNPVEFNEKIYWLKKYYHPTILTKLADKYNVRSYVTEVIGAEYLIPLVDYFQKSEDFNPEILPDSFIIKGTNGSKTNYIVEDKKLMKVNKIRRKITKYLRHNHYYEGFEWAYKDIPPGVVIEELIHEPGKSFLTDYKIYCFQGKPEFVQVISDLDKIKAQTYFDIFWNPLPFTKSKKEHRIAPLPKPEKWEEMLEIAQKLAGRFPFVRVDLYYIKPKIYFGELTFYPASGRTDFYPEEYNVYYGDLLHLPKLDKKNLVITLY